ncbi:MAG: hypothetical protein ACLPND_17700 [Candidatus Korobacteraceae bacterium]
MFQHITINRQRLRGEPIDLGFLAECLVFYEKVRMVSDVESFRYLVRSCGPDEVLELLRMGALEIEFFDNLTGVPTIQTNIGPLHDLATITSNETRYPQVSRQLVDELVGPSGKGASKMFREFSRLVHRSEFTKEMLDKAREDWMDESYVVPAIRSYLAMVAPEYPVPDPLRFRVEMIPGKGFGVSTNIDFEAANAAYHKHTPAEYSSLSQAWILISLADTRRDLMVGSRNDSEFALAPERALMASCKLAEILSTASHGTRVIDLFQEQVIGDIPSIRGAVNSGGRTFREVIQLIDKGKKFKEWLRKHESAEELRDEYLREVTHVDWADRLPTRSARWLLITAATTALGFAGGPLAGTAAAVGLSAADFFLLDKLLKGWKPNQFVEGPLKQFLRVGD